ATGGERPPRPDGESSGFAPDASLDPLVPIPADECPDRAVRSGPPPPMMRRLDQNTGSVSRSALASQPAVPRAGSQHERKSYGEWAPGDGSRPELGQKSALPRRADHASRPAAQAKSAPR